MTKIIEVPRLKATSENLGHLGKIVHCVEDYPIEIVTWPSSGWRKVMEGTGNEGGTVEGEFVMSWDNSKLYGKNKAVGHNWMTAVSSDPSHTTLLIHEANYHPDGGQLFFPLNNEAFYALLAPPGDDVRPEDFRAFYCDGSFGLYIHPNVWHQPSYYLCRGNLSVALPFLEKNFHFTKMQLGQLGFVSEIAYALGKFINGTFTDRIGGKKIFLLGMLGAILCNLLFAFSSSLLAFTVVWCFCRYFLSMGWPGLVQVVASRFPSAQYGRVMGFLSLSFQFGGVAATMLAAQIIFYHFSWEYLFTIPAMVLAGIMLLVFISVKEEKRSFMAKDVAVKGKFPIHLLKNPQFQLLLFLSLSLTFLRSTFLFWIPQFLVDHGSGMGMAAMQSTFFPLMGGLSTVILGFLMDSGKVDESKHMKYFFYLIAAAFFSLLLLTCLVHEFQRGMSLFWITLVLGLAGFFILGPYTLLAGVLGMDVGGKDNAAFATGYIDGIGYFGGALGPIVVGYIADRWSWFGVMGMLSGTCFFICCLLFLFFKRPNIHGEDLRTAF